MAALNTALRTSIGRSYGLLRRGFFGSTVVNKKKKEPFDVDAGSIEGKDLGENMKSDLFKEGDSEEKSGISSDSTVECTDEKDLGDIVRDDIAKSIQMEGETPESTENFAKKAASEKHSATSFSIDEMILESATDSTGESEGADGDDDDDDDECYYYDSEDDMKRQILNSSLEYVPEYGWTDLAIQKGAESEGLSSSIEGLFTKGAGDLVLHFIDECNARLAEQLSQESNMDEGTFSDGSKMQRSTTDFLQKALMMRLLMLRPYIHTWPEAMRLLMQPENATSAAESLAHMVDEIWYHAGDTSTDFNWYTKRGSVAVIYGLSELYMTQDRSVNFEDTRDFLKNRLENANELKRASLAMGDAVSTACSGLSVVLSAVQNILGYNSRTR